MAALNIPFSPVVSYRVKIMMNVIHTIKIQSSNCALLLVVS